MSAFICVHHVEDYIAALNTDPGAAVPGEALTLISAPGVAHYAGVLYLKEMAATATAQVPDVPHMFVIDCGEDAALATAALRVGHRHIAFSGPAEMAKKLADIAAQHGAELHCHGNFTQ